MRSLGAYTNVFAIESHIDDMAHAHGIDPIDYRLRHLTDPRARRVIESVAELADWGVAVGDNSGRGIGFARYKNSGAWCAVIADIEAIDHIVVKHLWIAVDCGRVVNPDGVINQIEGGAIQSASWTLMEQVRFADGVVTSSDWETYPILRFPDVPPVATTIVSADDEPWLGSGEASSGPTAAALGNAVRDALGVRVRDLPITPERIVAAMDM
jgi:CO/xanthine dehydrogenase Mo-binding subunit